MDCLVKRLQHQELAYSGTTPGRRGGQYFYIPAEYADFFPHLRRDVLNDTQILIVRLTGRAGTFGPSQCKYVYHNDKFHNSTAASPRNERRLYLNDSINPERQVLLKDDIVVIFQRTFLNEEGRQERFYLIVQVRQSPATARDFAALDQILQSGELRSKAYARIDEYQVSAIPAIRAAMHATDESVIQQPIAIHDVAVLQEVSRAIDQRGQSEENLDEEIGELEQQLKRMICYRYGYKCAVSGVGFRWEDGGTTRFGKLEGAHIKPRAHGGDYSPENIIPLRPDIHQLFDRGLFRITEDLMIDVHPAAIPERGLADLTALNGRAIVRPDGITPSRANLNHHRQHVFGIFQAGGQIRRID